MKKTFKKTLCLLLSLLLSVGIILPNTLSVSAASDVGTYLKSLIGTSAKEWGSAEGTQCVELPKYYIEKYYGKATKSLALGNGNKMYEYVPQKFPSLFEKISYYSGFVPQVGDIISYHSSTSPQYGHAAVVYAVSGNQYSIIEQWKGSGTVRSRTVSVVAGKYGVSYSIIGVARPKSNSVSYNPDDHTYPSRNIGYYNGTAMTGDDVMWVQCVLYQLGYLSQSGVDGSFGPNSKKAVASFQSDNGLSSDGSCGQITRAKLKECWEFKKNGSSPVDLGDKFYAIIVNDREQRPITVVEDDVVIGNADEEDQQKWKFERMGDKSYKITNIDTGKCLDVSHSLDENRANIIVYESTDNSNQRWFIYKNGTGYSFVPKCASTRSMDLNGAGNLALWTSETGNTNQIFSITVVENATKITFSSDTVNLGLTSNRTQTITGRIIGDFSHWQNDWDGDIVGIERTENDGEFEWKITARTAGTTDMILIAQDDNYDTIVEKRLRITVGLNTSDIAAFSFDANGGDFDTSSINVNYEGAIEIPYSVPIKRGYQFVGWTARRNNDNTWATEGYGWLTDSELASQGINKQLFGTGFSYGFDSSWINGLSSLSSYTFYAVWEASTLYSFGYDATGGSFDAVDTNLYYEETIPISNNIPIKQGYKFVGWNAKRDIDSTWATVGYGWLTDSELASQGIEKQLFAAGSSYRFDDSWLNGTSEISSYTFYAVWEPDTTVDSPYKLIIESKDAIITDTSTDTITVSLTLDNLPNIKTFALSHLYYNTDMFELVDFKWKTDGVLKSWNGSQAALTKESDTDMNGEIINLTFMIKEGVTEYIGDYSVSCNFTARQADGTVIQVAVVPGIISIKDVMRGDLDGNNIVNEDDAIYLLYSIFFEEDYPLNQDCDFDKNGKVDEDDAIYLLYYTFFPEDYPL